MIVGGVDISDWENVAGARELPDGRILLVTRRIYNTQLSISSTGPLGGWPNTMDDSY